MENIFQLYTFSLYKGCRPQIFKRKAKEKKNYIRLVTDYE